MAHENLKFRINLNDKKEWQPINAAQELQTFYVIYIKFLDVIESDKKIKDGNKALYKYQLRIQNFRGAISFGFCGNPTLLPEYEKNSEFCLELKVPLKAFHVCEYTEIVDQYCPDPVQRGKLLKVDSTLQLPEGMYNKTKPIDSPYMFPYRVERDGNTAIEIGRRTFGTNDKYKEYDDSELAGRPHGICSPNISIVF